MNDFEILRASSHRRVPWLNGGGWTTEIIAWPSRDSWEWRLSVANVDSAGPFSEFPGVDRTIAMLQGNGMVLSVDGTDTRIESPLFPFSFSGDDQTTCAPIDGPVQDLNLMVRRGTSPKRLVFVPVEESIQLSDFDIAVVVSGRVEVNGLGQLNLHDALLPKMPSPDGVMVSPAGSQSSVLAVVRTVT